MADLSHYLESALVEIRKKCLGLRQDFKADANHHNLNVKRFIYIITTGEGDKSYYHSKKPITKVYVEERYYRGPGRRGPVDRSESCSEDIDRNGHRICEYIETVNGYWEDVCEEDMSQIDRVEFKLPVSLRTWKHDDNISYKNNHGRIEDKTVILVAGDSENVAENRKGATVRDERAQQLAAFFSQTADIGTEEFVRTSAYESATLNSTARSHSPARSHSLGRSSRSRGSSKGSITIGDYIPDGVRLSSGHDGLSTRMHFDYSTRNSRSQSKGSNPYAEIADAGVEKSDRYNQTAAYVESTHQNHQHQQNETAAAYASTEVPSAYRNTDTRTRGYSSGTHQYDENPSPEHIYEEITDVNISSTRIKDQRKRSSSNNSGVVKAAYSILETLKKDYGIGDGADEVTTNDTQHRKTSYSSEKYHSTASEQAADYYHTSSTEARRVVGDDSEWKTHSGEVTYTVKKSRTEDALPKRPSLTSERRYSRERTYDEVANGRHSHSQSRSRSLGDNQRSSSQYTAVEKTIVTEAAPTTDFYSDRGRVRIDAAPNIRRNPSCDKKHGRYEEFTVMTKNGPVIVKRYSDGCITPLLNFHDWSVEELHFDYYKELNYDGIKPDPYYYQPYEEEEHIYEEIHVPEVREVTEVYEVLTHNEHAHTEWQPIYHAVPAVIRTPTPPPKPRTPTPPPLQPSPPPIVYETLYRTADVIFTEYVAEKPPTPPPPPKPITPPPPVDTYEPRKRGFIDFPEPEEYHPPEKTPPSHEIVPRRVKEMEEDIRRQELLDAERNKKPVPKRVWQKPKPIEVDTDEHVKHTDTEPIGPVYYHEMLYKDSILRQLAVEHHVKEQHKPTSVPASRATSRPSTPNPYNRGGSVPKLDEFDFPFDHVPSRRFSPSPTRGPIGGGVMSSNEDYRRSIEAHSKINGHSHGQHESRDRTKKPNHRYESAHEDLLIDLSDEHADLESAYIKREIRERSRHNKWTEDQHDFQSPRSPIDRRTDLESIVPPNSPFVNIKRGLSQEHALSSSVARSPSPSKHSHGYYSNSHQQDHREGHVSSHIENHQANATTTATHSHGHHTEIGYLGTLDKPEPLQSAYKKEEVVTKPGIVKQLTERFEIVEEHEPAPPPRPPHAHDQHQNTGYNAYADHQVVTQTATTRSLNGHSHSHQHQHHETYEPPLQPQPLPSPVPVRRQSQKIERETHEHTHEHRSQHHELPPATIDFGDSSSGYEMLRRSKEIYEHSEGIVGDSRIRTVHRTTRG